jgi:hypothetical protein
MFVTPKVELIDNQMIHVEPERVLGYMDDGTPVTRPEFIEALARGQLQTEAGTEALRAGVVMHDPSLKIEDGAIVTNADALNAYIETLERAVLTYRHEMWKWLKSDYPSSYWIEVRERLSAEETLTAALLEKYAEASPSE